MLDQATQALMREVRARRWNGARLDQALIRLGWSAAALQRIRSIGGNADVGQTKTVKRWINDKNDIAPIHQEWLERVMAVVEAGPSLFDGPRSNRPIEQFVEMIRLLEWSEEDWKEQSSHKVGKLHVPFAEVIRVPQGTINSHVKGRNRIPKRLDDALKSIMDGVAGYDEFLGTHG